MKYKYTGQTPVMINGVGIVQPESEFKTDLEINHPHINKVQSAKKVEKSTKKSKEQ